MGRRGSSVVALIAEKHLNDRAEAGIHELLGDDANISDAEVCNWADQIRRGRRDTAPWHYVNIPTTAPGYVATRDGNGGDNVIDAIGRCERVLIDRAAPKEHRAEALKFLVHFVGDIHQPLHCADRDGDRGGNGRLVFFLDRQKAVSLHSVWDTWLLRRYIGNRRIAEYAGKLDAQIKPDNAKAWQEGRRRSGRTSRTRWRGTRYTPTCQRAGRRRSSIRSTWMMRGPSWKHGGDDAGDARAVREGRP